MNNKVRLNEYVHIVQQRTFYHFRAVRMIEDYIKHANIPPLSEESAFFVEEFIDRMLYVH